MTQAQRERNLELAKEVCLSVNRYGFLDRQKIQRKLMACLKEAMRQGLDLSRNSVRNDVFSLRSTASSCWTRLPSSCMAAASSTLPM